MKTTVILDSERFDEIFRLSGDEDTGVSMECQLGDRRGLPIAYLMTHDGDDTYLNNDEVVRVRTITELIRAGNQHINEQHPK